MGASTICWSCEKVKGRRVCPARGGALICSKCCGTKRRVEIQCPEDCPYLHGADPSWRSDSRQREDARFLSRFLSLDERQIVFLLFFHHLLLTARARFGALGDAELAEVVGASAKTLETQAKGIVYQHPASSPHLDALASWLARTLAERSRIPSTPEASDADVAAVLRVVARAIEGHAADGEASYLTAAERVLRPSLENAPPIELPDGAAGPPPGLIVP